MSPEAITANNNAETVKHGVAGILASFFAWLMGFIKWYYHNMDAITGVAIHIAQLGGLIIMVYSIMILRRNWKTGKLNKNILQ